MPEQLSKMQQRIYDYIAEFIDSHGYPPSVREIGNAVGLKSPSTVHFHLKHLEAVGVIEKTANTGRAIVLSKRRTPKANNTSELASEHHNQVPILGNVAAGMPILAEECVEDYLTVDVGGRENEYFALRVRGESMRDAGILPGDLVVVRQQSEVSNGEIVVALFRDEATVKRYTIKAGHVWLMPENEAFSAIDGDRAQVLGKVTMVVRKY